MGVYSSLNYFNKLHFFQNLLALSAVTLIITVWSTVAFLAYQNNLLEGYRKTNLSISSVSEAELNTDDSTNWKIYRDEEFRFELKYPPNNWYLDNSGSYGIDYFPDENRRTVNLISERESGQEGNTEYVSISVLDKPVNTLLEVWLDSKYETASMQQGSITNMYDKQRDVFYKYMQNGIQVYEVGVFDKQSLTYYTFLDPTDSQYIYVVTLGLFLYGNESNWSPPDSYFINTYHQILSTLKFLN